MCPQLRLFVLESDGALTKEWVDRVTGGAWDVAQVEMERERVGGVGGEGWRDGGMEGWRCVCMCVCGGHCLNGTLWDPYSNKHIHAHTYNLE